MTNVIPTYIYRNITKRAIAPMVCYSTFKRFLPTLFQLLRRLGLKTLNDLDWECHQHGDRERPRNFGQTYSGAWYVGKAFLQHVGSTWLIVEPLNVTLNIFCTVLFRECKMLLCEF